LRRCGIEHPPGRRRSRATLVRGLAVAACAAVAPAFLPACSGSSDDAAPNRTSSNPAIPVNPAKSRILENRSFRCLGRVDLDLVRVTMRTAVDDAISLEENCTGRIGRIEVETWTADGIKVKSHGRVAHDLVIESGFVKCHEVAGDNHQDGIQVMGGRRITFRNLRIDCLGNANLFLAKGGQRASTPTDIVCEECVFGPNSGQTLFYADSIRSGVRRTIICTGRFRAIRVDPGARAIVEDGNTVLARDDPSCTDVTGRGPAG
jgi:hypothetical protein